MVFLEHWEDADALRAHFAVPASGEFVTGLADLTEGRATLEIYAAGPPSSDPMGPRTSRARTIAR